jgi:hypothetical protein
VRWTSQCQKCIHSTVLRNFVSHKNGCIRIEFAMGTSKALEVHAAEITDAVTAAALLRTARTAAACCTTSSLAVANQVQTRGGCHPYAAASCSKQQPCDSTPATQSLSSCGVKTNALLFKVNACCWHQQHHNIWQFYLHTIGGGSFSVAG